MWYREAFSNSKAFHHKLYIPVDLRPAMSQKKKQWHGGSKQKSGKQEKSQSAAPTATGPYIDMFQEYRKELDEKHDRHERIVKLSRDCTIHSKRIIYTLHRVSGSDASERGKVLQEAEDKLRADVLPRLKSIALEMKGLDPHLHHYAYAPGVEEFIEALTYLEYLKTCRLISPEEIVRDYLTFEVEPAPSTKQDGKGTAESNASNIPEAPEVEKKDSEKEEAKAEVIQFPLDPLDFVLGVADLTGELMRLGINSIGCGEHSWPFDLLPFMRALYCGFHSVGSQSKNMSKKMGILRASLAKVENVCYTLKIRGSEVPKQMLADMFNTANQRQLQQDFTDDDSFA